MNAETHFHIYDNRMQFDRAEVDMISTRIHRYYPKILRAPISRIRTHLIDAYRQADGQMVYNAAYSHSGCQRFQVKESFYLNADEGACNFQCDIGTMSETSSDVYNSIAADPETRIVDAKAAKEINVEFSNSLLAFSKNFEKDKTPIFGRYTLFTACLALAEFTTRFPEDLFVLEHNFNIQKQTLHVVLASRSCRSHVVTFFASCK